MASNSVPVVEKRPPRKLWNTQPPLPEHMSSSRAPSNAMAVDQTPKKKTINKDKKTPAGLSEIKARLATASIDDLILSGVSSEDSASETMALVLVMLKRLLSGQQQLEYQVTKTHRVLTRVETDCRLLLNSSIELERRHNDIANRLAEYDPPMTLAKMHLREATVAHGELFHEWIAESGRQFGDWKVSMADAIDNRMSALRDSFQLDQQIVQNRLDELTTVISRHVNAHADPPVSDEEDPQEGDENEDETKEG
ncbi:hypothetical protein CPB83DRAFT_899862 [Crepidotus variabilis]|uniref:Uncharacterized protein n=1 Tax=Crepidotus variabilis TaxID=179855 RepID=A0A9P6E468_9AGAR|nr:hypothetical protein CPB83DRAFT_899862 [Crepidotus variabilis]